VEGASASKLERAFAIRSLSTALVLQGRVAAALRALDEGQGAGPEFQLKGRLARVEALLADERRRPEALRELQAVAAAPEAAGWGLALWLAALGDLPGAARLAPALRNESERALYAALRAWRSGEKAQALSLARELAARPGPHQALALGLRAELASEERRDAEVVEAGAALRAQPAVSWRLWCPPQVAILEAEALERLGRRAEARQAVARLLQTWKRADPDLPQLVRARALQKRLGT